MRNREDIINSVDTSWPKDFIIRFLYVKLAPFFQRDLKFFFGNEELQYNMFINNLPNDDTHVTCYSLVNYYKKLFESFGIDCIIVTTNNNKIPHFALLVRGDMDWYFIDPLKDLMVNQVGLYTRCYGILPIEINYDDNLNIDISVLPREYIKEIDSILKLYKNNIYLDSIFELVHNELTTNQAYKFLENYFDKDIVRDSKDFYDYKMQFVNDKLLNISYIPGKIERAQYYAYMFGKICNHSERRGVLVKCLKNMPNLVVYNSDIYFENRDDNGRYFLKKEDDAQEEIFDLLINDSSYNVKKFLKNRKQ